MDGIDARKEAAARLLRDQPDSCPACWGSGKVANDEEASPWPIWDCLEGPSRMAVTWGIVTPMPCSNCEGTGVIPAPPEFRYIAVEMGTHGGHGHVAPDCPPDTLTTLGRLLDAAYEQAVQEAEDAK